MVWKCVLIAYFDILESIPFLAKTTFSIILIKGISTMNLMTYIGRGLVLCTKRKEQGE